MRPVGARSIPGSLLWLGALLLNATLVLGVKFELEAEQYPRAKWQTLQVGCVGGVVRPSAGGSRVMRQPGKDRTQPRQAGPNKHRLMPKPQLITSVWNFAGAKSLVIVSANTPEAPGQRIDIEILDGSDQGHVYLSKRDIKGETRLAITTHENADVGVCVRNHLETGGPKQYRTVDLDIDIGAEAVDYNAIANQESLSVLEVEMRKLEAVVKEIVDELGYLQRREVRMRDTNESTNTRVKNFSIIIMLIVVALGVGQLIHLRSFFKRKYLID